MEPTFILTTQYISVQTNRRMITVHDVYEGEADFAIAVSDYDEDDIVQAIRMNPDGTWQNVTDLALRIIEDAEQDARETRDHYRSLAPSRSTHL